MLAAAPAHGIEVAAEMVLWNPLNTPARVRFGGTTPVACKGPISTEELIAAEIDRYCRIGGIESSFSAVSC